MISVALTLLWILSVPTVFLVGLYIGRMTVSMEREMKLHDFENRELWQEMLRREDEFNN